MERQLTPRQAFAGAGLDEGDAIRVHARAMNEQRRDTRWSHAAPSAHSARGSRTVVIDALATAVCRIAATPRSDIEAATTRIGPPWVTTMTSRPGRTAAMRSSAAQTRQYISATLSPPGARRYGSRHRPAPISATP